MRAAQLTLDDLFSSDAVEGTLRLGDQRALLVDAASLGLLRTQLVDTFGITTARGFLTRWGFARGWRCAEWLRDTIEWDDDLQWQLAAANSIRIQGFGRWFAKVHDGDKPRAELVDLACSDSVEAEQHLQQLGQADQCTCWTTSGFLSGYLSCVLRDDFFCIEQRCRGKGDATCHLIGRRRRDWGSSVDSHLPYYEGGCIDAALRDTQERLHRIEGKLRVQLGSLGELEESDFESGVVARSQQMKSVLADARKVAKDEGCVAIYGESGVGKMRLAQYIHAQSARVNQPFLSLNCASQAQRLLEGELFGHSKGQPGLLSRTQGGSLLLREISDLPLQVQVRLTSFLEDALRQRAESPAEPRGPARLIVTSRKELDREVLLGRLREDLYAYLCKAELTIAPLRERPNDLVPLAQLKLKLSTAARRQGTRSSFTAAAQRKLLGAAWPGNVSELNDVIDRALVVSRGGVVDATDLPIDTYPHPNMDTATTDLSLPLGAIERSHILAVLEANGNNKSAAARQLGIGIATLHRKLKHYRAK